MLYHLFFIGHIACGLILFLLYISFVFFETRERTPQLKRRNKQSFASWVVIGLFFLTALPTYAVWEKHAQDLSVLRTNQKMVHIRDQQIDALKSGISSLRYPDTGSVIWNKDTPLKTMVESLSHAENERTAAKNRLVEAERSIEERQLSIWGGAAQILGTE